ncbi:hypothetical protein CHH28_01925 [Bacterioplanes sanyensis]|uniref:Peptidase n=1 Tax=Bacterioplanes sanyensis TaxID=1249553 RepID=A0A222FEJ0_9GAMM|nr:SapC family protein [Bacterioplanes sanyensis]ASP37505.1 hypothetical protein CHH28_01925 [Bacterioplanes sanyensis]
MSQYTAISKSRHREAGVSVSDFDFAAKQAVVPVTAQELSYVVPTMPLVFVPRWQDEGLQLSALQSLTPGSNVYVHLNGRWIGGYRPAWYRAHPFQLAIDEGSNRQAVCIDEASSAFHADSLDGDKPLFNAAGEPSDYLKTVMQFLQQLQDAQRNTNKLVDELNDAGVLVPWAIELKCKDDAEHALQGIYHVSESKLRALSDETLGALTRSGALSLAYAQLISEHRIHGLLKLHDLRNLSSQPSVQDAEVDLDALFGDDDDGNLSF